MKRLVRGVVASAVASVLRSRAHPLLSGALLLLTYRGRVTGRARTVPLIYARDGGDLLVVALHPAGQQWWRNVRAAGDVEVLLAGRRVRARATVVGADGAARAAYVAARPWTAPVLRRARDALFVRVVLAEPHDGGVARAAGVA